jgi:hypothetical protein
MRYQGDEFGRKFAREEIISSDGDRGGCLIRRLILIALCVGLSSCAFVREHFGFARQSRAAVAPAAAQAHAADGLWAVMDPGCEQPTGANFVSWPSCASPFWINQDTAVVVHNPQTRGRIQPSTSFRTGLTVTQGEPLIVQIGSRNDGYLFVALTDLARDPSGRVVGAAGAPVVCPSSILARITFRPNATGCESRTPDELREAAMTALSDRTELSRVAWIASGVPAAP